MTGFVGLHVHTEYSLLDGASQIPDMVNRAVELGMPAVALTDHGVMYGAIELIKICKSKGIKPIIGNEMYVLNGDITIQYKREDKKKKYHQCVLAKDTQGYRNLVKLTTISHLQGYQGKGIFARPCINKDYLLQYKEGLMLTSGCLAGEVPQAIMNRDPKLAREVAAWYQEHFGDDYYLEIQDHGYPEDRVVNVEICKIAKELDIKVIATNDSHFTSCMDVEAHDALLCIQTGKLISDEKRLRYSGMEYFKSYDEMKQLFRDHLEDDVIEEALANTLKVAAKVKPYDLMRDPSAANYPIPEGHTADTYFEEVTWQGLLQRFNAKTHAEISAEYQERLRFELGIIMQMGFATYFLVVWDYIKYARDKQIPVGPGRGSAAGSLVAYSLGITNIDPIHHGLLFERFLNPERKSMPDFDTDFCIDHRGELIDYVTQRYGQERVAQIVTFNRLTSKAVLKDVARVLDVSYSDSDKMAKMIPVSRGKPAKLKVMISEESPAPEFRDRYKNDAKVFEWLDMAMRIEGVNKSSGVHAAGVVISPFPLDEVVPLQRSNEGQVVTQYTMEDLESLGLLKMDFLGLKNLTTIEHTSKLIRENQDPNFHIDAIAPDMLTEANEKTYKLLEKGDLEGIFQLESSGMKQIVKDLKPSNIEDISSILALYRPGPLDAGLIPKFINRKHGREAIEYQHHTLEPILNNTYGVLCLAKGTLIARPDGTSTVIENIRKGDLILSSDGKRVWSAKVAKQWQSGIKAIVKITLSTGTEIYCSPEHRFLTPEGDRFAYELNTLTETEEKIIYGSVLFQLDVNSSKEVIPTFVVSVEDWGTAECFDIEMANQGSPYFLANGVVTHNCYQEQIMKMAQELAGYSLGAADMLRRAMGKKKPEEMEKQRSIFLDGCAKNGIRSEISNDLFDQMVIFAEYCLSYDTLVRTIEFGLMPIGKIVEHQIECNVYSVDENGFV
ncbi:MAG: DNA polymerase III subunit alpha, partial [Pseudanabaena sp.]